MVAAGEALEEIEGRALARQDGASRAAQAGHFAAIAPGAFRRQRFDLHSGVERREDGFHYGQTAKHARSLLQDEGAGLRLRGYGEIGGNVAAANVLCEGKPDDLIDG